MRSMLSEKLLKLPLDEKKRTKSIERSTSTILLLDDTALVISLLAECSEHVGLLGLSGTFTTAFNRHSNNSPSAFPVKLTIPIYKICILIVALEAFAYVP